MTSPCTRDRRPAGRHDMVSVDAKGWRAMLATRNDLAGEPLVARWAEEGWPAIRRRAIPGESSGTALGMPLPPFAGKKRLAFVVQADNVVSIARPPSLNAAREAAPASWRSTLERLDKLSRRHGVEARVFGSLAWQTLTGLDYLTGRSDLDLLLDIDRDIDLERLTADLAAIEADAPMRLDGELMRGDGAAVNWRELHSGADEVLVKSIDGVGLVGRRAFIAGGAVS
jgi:phosphoribosyl-dephospho-CoA transferase